MNDKKEKLKAWARRHPEQARGVVLGALAVGKLKNEAHTCAVCFAPPGVDCNYAPGWCGAIDAGPHKRKQIENPCESCRGTGRLGIALDVCSACKGTRTRGTE